MILLLALVLALPAEAQSVDGAGAYQDNTHPLGQTGDGLDKHHVPSRESYKDHPDLNTNCGPSILMPPEWHRLTASHGSGSGAVNFRFLENVRIHEFSGDVIRGFLNAFEMNVADLRSLQGTNGIPANAFEAAIRAAREYITSGRMQECIGRNGKNTTALVPGTAVATTRADKVETSVEFDEPVTISASGLTPGDEYYLAAADGYDLMKRPWFMGKVASPLLTVGSDGRLSVVFTPSTRIYWEVGGEVVYFDHRDGVQAQFGFVEGFGRKYTHPVGVVVKRCRDPRP